MTHDPQRASQEDPGGRHSQEDPAQPSMPPQRGRAQGTATISREQQARERAAPPLEHRPPKSHLPLKIAGLVGVLLLAGLIAGLVASNTPTPTSTSPPAVHTVFKFGAHGPAVSPNFVVRSSPVTSSYSYRCPAGVAGRFTANLMRSVGTDSHTIVDTTAPSLSGSTTLHPAHVGSLYHVAATAPAGCGYQINTVAP
jgi:hypothetical protein